MGRSIFIVVFTLCSLVITDEINAQRTRTRTTPTSRTPQRTETSDRTRSRQVVEERDPIAKQWMAISLGNLGFGGGFSLSGKYSYGFEFERRISVGANAKFYYDFLNGFGNQPDFHLFSYGASAFTRIKITNDFFLQGEYSYTSFDSPNDNPNLEYIFPAAGVGYRSGWDDWTFGMHVLFPFNQRVRNLLNIEYWIDFNYKF